MSAWFTTVSTLLISTVSAEWAFSTYDQQTGVHLSFALPDNFEGCIPFPVAMDYASKETSYQNSAAFKYLYFYTDNNCGGSDGTIGGAYNFVSMPTGYVSIANTITGRSSSVQVYNTGSGRALRRGLLPQGKRRRTDHL